MTTTTKLMDTPEYAGAAAVVYYLDNDALRKLQRDMLATRHGKMSVLEGTTGDAAFLAVLNAMRSRWLPIEVLTPA